MRTDTPARQAEPVTSEAEQFAHDHVRAFNAAVESGDWAGFADRFTTDAVLEFVGPPVGPFTGRDAILSAYLAMPPDETMTIAGPVTVDQTELAAPFRWDGTGATGSMRISRRHDLVARLVVGFD